MKLEELLVEETWSEVLQGELQKPYAKKLCEFVESETCHGSVPIYPPQHLIFNALNITPFNSVKAVIIGQVKFSSYFKLNLVLILINIFIADSWNDYLP